jgi:hypothetical protein
MAAALSFDSAYRQIRRGDLAPVYYLTGEEDVLKDELITFVQQQVVDPASRDFNLDVRSAGDLDGESLHTLVETPPMLAERRVVVVKNLEQWRKNAKVWRVLEQYLANPSPTTVLLIVHGAGEAPNAKLKAHAVHVKLEPLNPERLVRWVERRSKETGFTIEPEAVEHLVSAVSGDLSHLAMEVEKLAIGSMPCCNTTFRWRSACSSKYSPARVSPECGWLGCWAPRWWECDWRARCSTPERRRVESRARCSATSRRHDPSASETGRPKHAAGQRLPTTGEPGISNGRCGRRTVPTEHSSPPPRVTTPAR